MVLTLEQLAAMPDMPPAYLESIRAAIDERARQDSQQQERDKVSQKGMLTTLQQALRFNAEIINNAPIGIIVYKKRGDGFVYELWNKQMERMTGMDAAHVLGKNPVDLFPHFREQGIETMLQEALRGKTLKTGDVKFTSPATNVDGWVRSIYAPQRDAGGNVTGVIGLVRDIGERKQKEDELNESQRRIYAILNGIPDPAWCKGVRGEILAVNQVFADAAGKKAHELIGLTDLDLWPRDLAEKYMKDDRYVAETGQTLVTEEWFAAKGGKWVETIKNPMVDPSGIVGTVGIARDITDRKRHEQESKRNEARLESLLRIAQHPAQTTQALLDAALEEAVALTGSKIGYIYHYNPEKQLFILNTWSKKVMAQCSVQQPETVYSLEKTGVWGEAVRQGRPIILNDFAAPHPQKKGLPDGHAPLYRFMTVPVKQDGGIVAVVGVANKETDYDETDVKQLTLMMESVWTINDYRAVKDKLVKSEQRYKALFHHANDAIFVHELTDDTPGRFIDANDIALERMGYNLEELLKLTPADIHPPNDTSVNFGDVAEQLHRTGSYTVETFHQTKDGKVIPVEIRARTINIDGVPVVLTTARDLTTRKELEEKLLQAQKMEAIGRLAGGVAHDFNNVLTAVLGYGELLTKRLSGEELEYVKLIYTAGERAKALTQQLLTFSRRHKTELKPVDMNNVLSGSTKFLRHIIGEDIDIVEGLAGRHTTVLADESQLVQVVMNLAVNAKDAMPDGGQFSLSTRAVRLKQPLAGYGLSITPGDYVILSVSDTGTGISDEVKRHLFEPFYTTKDAGKGTGLGLSIIHGIVASHKGAIQIQSEMNKGTTFNMYFPACATQPEHYTTASVPPVSGVETVLLVEDNASVMQITNKLLTLHGYTVLCAAHPEEAKRIAASTRVDLVLTDVVMPGQSGPDLVAEMQRTNPALRCVYMSGYSGPELSTMVEPLLQKPFTHADLLIYVRAALDGKKPASPGL